MPSRERSRWAARISPWIVSEEACALKRVLHDNDYDYKSDKDTTNDSCVSPGESIERATVFLSNAGDVASACLGNFHLGNHTLDHPKINRHAESAIDLEITKLDVKQNGFLGRPLDTAENQAKNTFTALRAPFCDGQKTFDAEAAERFVHFGETRGVHLLSDSSVGYLANSVKSTLASGSDPIPTPPGLKAFMTRKPYPFTCGPGSWSFRTRIPPTRWRGACTSARCS